MFARQFLIATLSVTSLALSSSAGAEASRRIINPSSLPDTTRFGYSHAAVVAPGARTIFVAGQVGVSDQGPNDFKSQVDRSFANLLAVLEAAGSDARHVVKITVLIKDHNADKLKYLIETRRRVFGDQPPASTLIPVSALALESFEFEIDAVAVVPQ